MIEGGAGMADRLARAGITEREADVLAAVALRLRNREIAERLHVSVRTVETHIASLLRKLGAPDRAALIETGGQLRRGGRPDATMPTPLTSLVGRRRETLDVTGLLAANRLITLIGTAGVGKTRLALHVAAGASDGVHFADLAPLTAAAPELIGDAFARALGVAPEPGWSLADTLRDVVADTGGLLVVDNCEHVVEPAAELVAQLLGATGRLRILATSREPLGVPGEVTYRVPPLDPAEAVLLFGERGGAAAPGFALTDSVTPAVTALCDRLDGLPLAIELAASRLRTFGPAELVEHLDQRFELLSAGARTLAPRHRTLRSSIDWSYDLLEERERELFHALGVFPADFDFDAVRAVHGPAAMSLLPTLVDKSLVTTVDRGSRRYRLLETIRAYAAERLARSDAAAAPAAAHATHYLTLADDIAQRLQGADQRVWLDRLSTEEPNLNAALTYTIENGDTHTAWRAVAALHRFWDVTGRRRSAQTFIRRILALGDPPATPTVVAGLAAASGLLQSSDSQSSLDLAQRAARCADELDDLSRARAALAIGMSAPWVSPELVLPSLHRALTWFGEHHPWEAALTMQGLAMSSAELSEALDWGRRALAGFRAAGDDAYAANTLAVMAQRAMVAGVGDDEVHAWLTESRALAEAARSDDDMVHASVGFAQLTWLRGDHDDAADLMEQCLPTLRRLGDRRCAARALFMLGEHARDRGRPERAEELLRSAAETVAVAGQSFLLVQTLETLAGVLAAQSRPRGAAVLLGAASAVRDAAAAHPRRLPPQDPALLESLAAYTAAYTEGRTAPDVLHTVRTLPPN